MCGARICVWGGVARAPGPPGSAPVTGRSWACTLEPQHQRHPWQEAATLRAQLSATAQARVEELEGELDGQRRLAQGFEVRKSIEMMLFFF